MRLVRAVAVAALVPVAFSLPVVDLSHAQPRPVAPELQTIEVVLPESVTADTATGPGEGVDETTTADAVPGEAATFQTERLDVDEFSMVGVTWDATQDVVSPTVQVRTDDGSGWGEWVELPALDGGPDPGTEEARRARTGTESLWVGGSTAVQVRVSEDGAAQLPGTAAGLEAATEPTTDAATEPTTEPTTGPTTDAGGEPAAAAAGKGSGGGLPATVELVLIDPGTSPADDRSGPLASADADGPGRIITRAEWGADESLRTCEPSYSSTLRAGVLHHTAGPSTYSTQAAAIQQLRADYAYHTRTLGWCDLGYNFVVDKWGNVYEGRAGGVDRPVMGAHSGGFNRDTFGVAVLGTYSSAQAPAAAIAAAERLFAWKFAWFGIDPQGSTQLTSAGGGTSRYPAGQVVTVRTFSGHRDVGQTECPGLSLYGQMNGMRARMATMVDDFAVTWFQRGTVSTGVAEKVFPFGQAGGTAVACDWDGDRRDTPGIFSAGSWTLRQRNEPGAPDVRLGFGQAGDIPLCGDWNGDGKATPGLYRPSNYTFYLSNTLRGGVADVSFSFGNIGDRPLTGDWDGDGKTSVGLFRPSNVTFYLRNSNSTGPANGAIPFGNSTDTPITGAWAGSRFTTIGVYRDGVMYLKNSNFPGPTDRVVGFGGPGDVPVVGDWNGDHTTTPGIVRGAGR